MRVVLFCTMLLFAPAAHAATVEPLYFTTKPADLVFTPPADGVFGNEISIGGTIAGSKNVGGLAGLAFAFTFNADFITAALTIAGHTAFANFNSAFPFNHDDPRPADTPALDDSSPFFLGHGEFFATFPTSNPGSSDPAFFDFFGVTNPCGGPGCQLTIRYAFDYYGEPPFDGTVPGVSATFWLPEYFGESTNPAPVPLPAGGPLMVAAFAALAALRRDKQTDSGGDSDTQATDIPADGRGDADAFGTDRDTGVELRIFAAG